MTKSVQAPTHTVVANAIRHTGARPLYANRDLESTTSTSDTERRVTLRTRMLVLQHTFGIPLTSSAPWPFAERHSLVVIEDCVHSLGAHYRGRPVGGFGPAAFFSSEETKNGLRPVGYERRMSNAQAVLGVSQLSDLEANLAYRRLIAALYTRLLQRRGLRTPAPPPGRRACLCSVPIWVENREVAHRELSPFAVVGTLFTSVLEDAASPQHGDYELARVLAQRRPRGT